MAERHDVSDVSAVSSETIAAVERAIDEQLAATLDDLKRLARIPSVSSKGNGEDMAPAAELVGELLRGCGFQVQVMPTEGFPVVYADSGPQPSPQPAGQQGGQPGGQSGSQRTLLCYNHYDVQPAEPLDLWVSPPFDPTERAGRLYARGISDDKGQLISRIAAIRAVRAVTGALPARVKFLVEGEEEIGSVHLEPFVERHADLLASDACVWEFGGVDAEGRPLQTLGLRGLLYVELRVRTMSRDAHSGGAHNMPNAAWRLLRALATIKGEDETILIPGFYDEMQPPSATERRLLEEMPSEEEFTRSHFGIEQFVGGHTGLDYKTAVYKPTANIAGIGAGWQGQGAKTVIPAYAMAKMDFRLLPDQDPKDLFAKLRQHLDAQGFGDVELVLLGGERGATTPVDDPFVALVIRIAGEVYAKPVVVNPISGGSGPVWAFRHYLGVPIVTMGCGDPESNAHSPNESISIEGFRLATHEMARVLMAYGAGQG